jgi:cytochrome c5
MRVFTRSFAAIAVAAALMILAGAMSGAAAQSLADKGEELARTHCSRCHVVADGNAFSGIGSTPSFRLLVNALADWRERFETFHTRRPHPAVVRFEGIAPLSENPPTTRTVDLKLDDIPALVAYAASLKAQ